MNKLIILSCLCICLLFATDAMAGKPYAGFDFREADLAVISLEESAAQDAELPGGLVFKVGTFLSKNLALEGRADLDLLDESSTLVDASLDMQVNRFGLYVLGRF